MVALVRYQPVSTFVRFFLEHCALQRAAPMQSVHGMQQMPCAAVTDAAKVGYCSG